MMKKNMKTIKPYPLTKPLTLMTRPPRLTYGGRFLKYPLPNILYSNLNDIFVNLYETDTTTEGTREEDSSSNAENSPDQGN